MDERKKIVFLGTPQVAADALKKILEHGRFFQVVAVVSQPPARAVRGSGEVPSPVHKLALENGIPVLTPETARDEKFLSDLKLLAPDLCITAAYGNVLPQSFLDIPPFGTLNIHPSLLPLYRGAAPVQRAVEDGVKQSGVSILYTVQKMDAGPIVFQKTFDVNDTIKAPELLQTLFMMGAELLVEGMPKVFDKQVTPRPQDDSFATKAKKMSVEEGFLDFNQSARRLHNKVRGFAGWPGTRAVFEYDGLIVEVKIITTRVAPAAPLGAVVTSQQGNEWPVKFASGALKVRCGDGEDLEIVELQAPGKRAMAASDFWNGLKIKTILCRMKI